ncbi:MAG: hypothetical protein KGQ42_09090 [Alphaproteobacteria bacterium]|nr:hypothetical protein [Alphaproteobacteria bacterium]MDE2041944.1 hypothetical protein [Alphaproteobacteria bacterium]MDE2341654.1 hypothetical protein [Alphaproteobacteria bacterium]
MTGKQQEALRRVQVGLAGLALIIGVLAVSNAIQARLNPDQPHSAAASAQAETKVTEPMARMGIAPADQTAAATNTAAPAATNSIR